MSRIVIVILIYHRHNPIDINHLFFIFTAALYSPYLKQSTLSVLPELHYPRDLYSVAALGR
jgi:hypothetical protein